MTEPVLAGWSWVTPLGRGTEALERIRAGETALVPPPEALAPYGVPHLAQVPAQPGPSPHARVLHRMSLLGLEAAITLAEVLQKPTTMMYRNFLAMETEELLRSYPVDGCVLMGGCDKTTPGTVMGATSWRSPRP